MFGGTGSVGGVKVHFTAVGSQRKSLSGTMAFTFRDALVDRGDCAGGHEPERHTKHTIKVTLILLYL